MTSEDKKYLEKIKTQNDGMYESDWLIVRLEAEAQENERLQQELHGRRLTEMDRLENLGNRAEAAEADRDAIREEWTRVFATLRKERDAAEATCQSLREQSSRWEAQALEAGIENERLQKQIQADASTFEARLLAEIDSTSELLVVAEARCAELEAQASEAEAYIRELETQIADAARVTES